MFLEFEYLKYRLFFGGEIFEEYYLVFKSSDSILVEIEAQASTI